MSTIVKDKIEAIPLPYFTTEQVGHLLGYQTTNGVTKLMSQGKLGRNGYRYYLKPFKRGKIRKADLISFISNLNGHDKEN